MRITVAIVPKVKKDCRHQQLTAKITSSVQSDGNNKKDVKPGEKTLTV